MKLLPLRISIFLSTVLLCGFADPKPVMFDAVEPNLIAGGIAKVQGLLSKPDGAGPFPAVVILHTCGGVRDNLSHVWPAFYVKHGYVALTVDSFGSRGVGNCPNDFTRLRGVSGIAPYEAVASDAHGALAYLENQPFIKKGYVAIVGHSFGGIAIHMAILRSYATAKPSRAFRAAISLYGPCVVRGGTIIMPKLTQSALPLLEIIGENDERILRPCQKHLPRHPSVEFHILPGAYHAFDIAWFTTMRHGHAGAKMLYHAGATQKARELIRAFLTRHLKSER